MEFNSSDYVEFKSECYFFSGSSVVEFLRHPEPPPTSSSDLSAARIRQKPNPNAIVGVWSQVSSRKNPENVNSYPSPIPTNVQKTVFPSGRSPTVVTPQIFPIVNQRSNFWLFWNFQKFSGNISSQMSRSFYKVLGFILNERKLFLIFIQSLVEIINMESLHGLRNVFWFENLFVFSSFVVEKLIVVDDVTIFELLWVFDLICNFEEILMIVFLGSI